LQSKFIHQKSFCFCLSFSQKGIISRGLLCVNGDAKISISFLLFFYEKRAKNIELLSNFAAKNCIEK